MSYRQQEYSYKIYLNCFWRPLNFGVSVNLYGLIGSSVEWFLIILWTVMCDKLYFQASLRRDVQVWRTSWTILCFFRLLTFKSWSKCTFSLISPSSFFAHLRTVFLVHPILRAIKEFEWPCDRRYCICHRCLSVKRESIGKIISELL